MGTQRCITSIKRTLSVVGILLAVFVLSYPDIPVRAQAGTGTVRVAPTGADVSGCGSAEAPCQTIQYAVNLATAGDTIKIAQGTYTGAGTAAVVSIQKNLTLIGGYTTTDWDTPSGDPTLTVIDGQNARRGFELNDVPGSVAISIQGISVRNGLSNVALGAGEFIGGGLLCRSGGADKTITLALTNMIFENNLVQGAGSGAAAGGGAGFYEKCPVTLQNVTFTGNQVLAGAATDNSRGGHALGGGFFATNDSHVTANGIVLTGNVAEAGSGGQGYLNNAWDRADGLGGGAAMQYNQVSIVGVTATGNQATGGAGALYGGYACGGGLFFEHNASVYVADGVISGNRVTGGAGYAAVGGAAEGGGASSGGGIMSTDSVLTLERLIILNNYSIGGAGNDGGDGGGGGLYFARAASPWGAPSTVTGVNLIIADNVAEAGAGDNRWGGGGGIFSQNTDLTLYHATIAGNQVLDTMQAPGVIALNYAGTDIGWSTTRLYYSIIADHNPAGFSYAAVALGAGDTLQMNYTLFYNNAGRNYGGSGAVSNSNEVPSGDPAFVSSGSPNYNYHIGSSSAARDQAVGSPTPFDVDQDARPVGAASDIGADEYVARNAQLIVLKSSTPSNIVAGGSSSHLVAHQITVQNTGEISATVPVLREQLPTLAAPLAMSVSTPTCTGGICTYDAGTRLIVWTGNVLAGGSVTISYNTLLTVPTDYTSSTAVISTLFYNFFDAEGGAGSDTFTAVFFINARRVYLPLTLR